MADDLYCIDASSLIELKQAYPRKVFPGVWEKIEDLVRTHRLIAPDEVSKEIEKDDILGPWAKQNKKMFRKANQEQMDAAKDVTSRFQRLAKAGKFGPAADPFVVALARLENQKLLGSLLEAQSGCVVVTEERPSGIPAACAHYKLTCVALLDLFHREGWTFP